MRKILWFRRDLRVEDSMLLAQGGEVLPIFIFDTDILSPLSKNDRRVAFIYHQVITLKASLKALGLDLALFYGTPEKVFAHLKLLGEFEVYASVDYDAYALKRDATVASLMPFHSLNDTYLFEPKEILKKDGSAYLVFTPFYHACRNIYTQFHVLKYTYKDASLIPFPYDHLWHITHDMARALPIASSSIGFEHNVLNDIVSPYRLLKRFANKIDSYSIDRDFLDRDATSHLSVHLRFGTISIREVVRYLVLLKKKGHVTEPFFRQLIFREFYAYLLYHFPKLAWENYRYTLPIKDDPLCYDRFCTARTGYPIVDAAVTELVTTGQMHNRARMIVGSFFTKHLLLPWQKGEAFFARHLLDYDASANVLSWQWCAGTGIDPQPYFRIFNPYTQAQKFDKEARYIKHYLPQLKDVPSELLHKESYLMTQNDTQYPRPIVEHDKAREYFLKSFNV